MMHTYVIFSGGCLMLMKLQPWYNVYKPLYVAGMHFCAILFQL